MTFKNGRGNLNPLVIATHKVKIIGKGTVDFRKDSIYLEATPRAKNDALAGVATPFKISGKLSNPTFKLEKGAGTSKVVGEAIMLPFNILGTLFSSDVKPTKGARAAPCKLQKQKRQSGKKKTSRKGGTNQRKNAQRKSKNRRSY